MECTSCGETVNPSQRRCPSCFNYVRTDEPMGVHETEVGGRFCIRCGKKNEARTTQCERCGRGLEGFLSTATIVANRYIVLPDPSILRRAGQLAVDMQAEETCTVKVGVLLGCNGADEIEQAARRFGMARNFEHPNLVRVRDFSVDTRAGYVVFDQIEGRDLEAVLVEEGMPWLPEHRSLPLIHQVLSALDYLQARRPMVVLADLSPDSVIDDNGHVWVLPLDWRDALVLRHGRQPYRAPDSFMGHPSALWDVYSASALLHHLVTGQSPISRLAWDFPPVRRFNSMLPEDLERIISRGLSAHHLRYPSASYLDAEIVLHFAQYLKESPRVQRARGTPRQVRRPTSGRMPMTSPGRFSRTTVAETATVSAGGRGLLKAPSLQPANGAAAFRPLRTVAMPGDDEPIWTEPEADEAEAAPIEVAPATSPVWQRVAPALKWIHGEYGSILPDFVVTNLRVVVGTWEGGLRGLSPHEGETIWEARVEGGTWYNLTALHATVVGQVWSLPTRPEERPAFVGLHSHDLSNGNFLWEHDAKLSPYGTGTSHMAVVEDHLAILFVNQDKTAARLIALDEEGKVVWVRDLTGKTAWGGVTSTGVCLWNEKEGALLLDGLTGETRWFHEALHIWRPLSGRSPYLFLPAVGEGAEMLLLQGHRDDGLRSLVAVSALDGEVWWQRCLGPATGSYVDSPPCIVTTIPGRVLCSVPWEFRGQFRHSLFHLDPVYGLPVWASDVRSPVQDVLVYGDEDPVVLASTPIRQSHVWGPFSHYRSDLPCVFPHLDTARPRVGSSPMRSLDAATGRELWRSGKHATEALSFRLKTNGWELLAAASDGRLHAYSWAEL